MLVLLDRLAQRCLVDREGDVDKREENESNTQIANVKRVVRTFRNGLLIERCDNSENMSCFVPLARCLVAVAQQSARGAGWFKIYQSQTKSDFTCERECLRQPPKRASSERTEHASCRRLRISTGGTSNDERLTVQILRPAMLFVGSAQIRRRTFPLGSFIFDISLVDNAPGYQREQ